MLVTIETIAKATYSTLFTDLQKTFCAPDYFPLFQTFSPYKPLKLLEHERIENYTFGEGGYFPPGLSGVQVMRCAYNERYPGC